MSKRDELRKRRQDSARRQQIIIIGLVAVVAIIVAAVLIYPQLQPVGQVVAPAAFSYPPADGKNLGPKDAKVVIQLYSDFQCPYCRQFAGSTEQQIIQTYIAAGKSVRLEYHHFVVVDGNTGGTESEHSAEASECAADQGKFWQFHDYLYANSHSEGQGELSDKRIKAFAQALGLDTGKFNSCFDSGQYAQNVSQDQAKGQGLGISGTPTLFVGVTRINNPLDFNEIKAAIDAGL